VVGAVDTDVLVLSCGNIEDEAEDSVLGGAVDHRLELRHDLCLPGAAPLREDGLTRLRMLFRIDERREGTDGRGTLNLVCSVLEASV